MPVLWSAFTKCNVPWNTAEQVIGPRRPGWVCRCGCDLYWLLCLAICKADAFSWNVHKSRMENTELGQQTSVINRITKQTTHSQFSDGLPPPAYTLPGHKDTVPQEAQRASCKHDSLKTRTYPIQFNLRNSAYASQCGRWGQDWLLPRPKAKPDQEVINLTNKGKQWVNSVEMCA